MNRKGMILEYIEANPLCTKTKVKNAMPFAHQTTDNILKELIEIDEKVICKVDEKNPRIHHLLINDKDKYRMISSLLGPFTCTQLVTDDGQLGEAICCPTPVNDGRRRLPMPIVNINVLQTLKEVMSSAKWY